MDNGQFEFVSKIVLGGYLLMLMVIGYLGYRKSVSSEEDYYLAGREQGWIVSSLTIMATFFSSFALLGAPGLVYKEGIVFALFALNIPLGGAAVYLLGSRMSRLGRAGGYVTPADMICDYYESKVGLRLLTMLIGFLYAVPYVVMQINAGGIVSKVLFPHATYAFEIGACCLALVTMVYIMVGGMRSVAWTDVIQGSLLLGGMLLAGVAVIGATGGLAGFAEGVSRLPPKTLSAPGTTGSWPIGKLFTVCLFASLGSMIQPAQWMRYYSARSSHTLRRSALIFGTVLPVCYFFGVMLVGLGGQVLYPIVDGSGNYLTNASGAIIPHSAVGETPKDFDNILAVVLRHHLPELLGPAGMIITSIVFVAILAASMSTADSNLHALSAVATRDVYDRFLRPGASQRERTWVGRLVIAGATVLALCIILAGRTSGHFNPVALISQMGLLAIAFSTQLLPVTLDILFIHRGTRAGAIAGLVAGVAIVSLFTPFPGILTGGTTWGGEVVGVLGAARKMVDLGAWGLIGNVLVFAAVSAFTRRPQPERVREFKRIASGEAS